MVTIVGNRTPVVARPTFYQISEIDGRIAPDLERSRAGRSKAKGILPGVSARREGLAPCAWRQLIDNTARGAVPA